MKDQYIRDLGEGSRVDSLFALRSRDLRSARTGEPYLSLELGDRSGRMHAVMFRPGPTEESLPVGSVVRVRGSVTTFRAVPRVTVESLTPAAVFEPGDFLASGTRDREELLGELREAVRRIRDARLRAVVRAVFGAPGFIERFAACPAAAGRHHAYVGGLLEHTISVATLCAGLAAAYPQADADLLIAAALLHDVGKTEELTSDTSFGLTEAGHLIGHVVLGERIVSRAIESLARPLPAETAMKLLHAVLAHHGEREWGAPRCPCTIEALLLHHADHTDAQAAAFTEAVSGAAVLQQQWSDRSNGFGRALLVPAPPERACHRVPVEVAARDCA
jgi:3'-5' exoribonuclease